MPITPLYEWEETDSAITLTVSVPGVKTDSIDVYCSDTFVKVNAERYLLALDLKHPVVHHKTSHRRNADAKLCITLAKEEEGLVWGELKASGNAAELKTRRQESISRAEQYYSDRLKQRKHTKTEEEKRYFNQSWDIEKAQRKDIEERVRAEREEETSSLAQWEAAIDGNATPPQAASQTPSVPLPKEEEAATDSAAKVTEEPKIQEVASDDEKTKIEDKQKSPTKAGKAKAKPKPKPKGKQNKQQKSGKAGGKKSSQDRSSPNSESFSSSDEAEDEKDEKDEDSPEGGMERKRSVRFNDKTIDLQKEYNLKQKRMLKSPPPEPAVASPTSPSPTTDSPGSSSPTPSAVHGILKKSGTDSPKVTSPVTSSSSPSTITDAKSNKKGEKPAARSFSQDEEDSKSEKEKKKASPKSNKDNKAIFDDADLLPPSLSNGKDANAKPLTSPTPATVSKPEPKPKPKPKPEPQPKVSKEGPAVTPSSSSSSSSSAPLGASSYGDERPAVRETVKVKVDFTPTVGAVPSRGSHDVEYYHQSRYKPKNLEDTPFYWKETGDKLYHQHNWKGACDAYCEALKRDPSYMTAVCNRAACWLRLHNYARALDDSCLALNMIGNAPASSCTAEKYRYLMCKMLVRRGTARAWSGDLVNALEDYNAAIGYKVTGSVEIAMDMESLEEAIKARGLSIDRELTEAQRIRCIGDKHFNFNELDLALARYNEALEMDPAAWSCLANRTACYLMMRRFEEANADCDTIIQHCSEVAQALNDQRNEAEREDSDDEQDAKVFAKSKRDALLKSSTRNIYMLLKVYIWKGAALCGLEKFHDAAHFLEKALAITPYDDDLRDDCVAVAEKIRNDTLVAASKGEQVDRPP